MPSNKKPKVQCHYCNKGFVKIEKHIVKCNENRNKQSSLFKCSCGCEFSSFESFDKHLLKHECFDYKFEHLNIDSINLSRGKEKPKCTNAGLSSLPFFGCSNIDSDDLAIQPKQFCSYLDELDKGGCSPLF